MKNTELGFNYDEMVSRNLGFISQEDQEKIRRARVFICGVGGMGGAAAMGLARAGLGHMDIADIDVFEISNLNRQVFCHLESIDQPKAEVARKEMLAIHPEMDIIAYDASWTEHVEELVERADIVINGTDDLGASLQLYRTARALKKPVIDAYASPLPSVYLTRASEPMPEERLGYPTLGVPLDQLTKTMRENAFEREVEFVMMNSSARHFIDLDMAGEVVAGRRARMSFAPMVITTGMLMTYEALKWIIKGESCTDYQGWFFNPYQARVERPRSRITQALLRPIVRRQLKALMEPE